jgi:hypothetical protein
MSNKADDLNFRPFTVLLGIILGTVFAITFCTCIVGLVFWYLGDEAPRLAAEVDGLMEIVQIFVVLTAFAATSFIATLKSLKWRYFPLTALWLGLLLTGYYYWP